MLRFENLFELKWAHFFNVLERFGTETTIYYNYAKQKSGTFSLFAILIMFPTIHFGIIEIFRANYLVGTKIIIH